MSTAIISAVLACAIFAQEGPKEQRTRLPNTTLHMPADPDGGFKPKYQLTQACAGLTFEKPVAVVSPPGDSNRLFVVERPGKIIVVTNLAQPSRTVFLDLADSVTADWETGKVEGLSSLAFHPGYLTNRFPYFYVSYTLRVLGPDGGENYNRIARFQSTRGAPTEALRHSELPLITQIDHGEGHNFNCLLFGPDGYLYAALGDEGDGGTGDDFNNAQRIDKNFFSGILRIDVDQREGNVPPNPHPASSGHYAIPMDNPWLGATQFNGKAVSPAAVRTEFYAVGLRNPWRMSFDPVTGHLYEGDVGQHGREEVNIIIKGGNYGWAFREGTLTGPKGKPPEGVTLLDPIYEYSPGFATNQGFSITGGVVYRGPSLPELTGAYLFADYVSGHIWALRYDGTRVTEVQHLATHKGIAGFGIDPRDGEMLIIDHDQGRLLHLTPAQAAVSDDLPELLSETGAFADLESLKPSAGIVPYEVNHPFWSDGAHKRRWFSVPDPQRQIDFHGESNWVFPSGTVWIKHFELTNALPVSRRLETRLLVKNESGVYGVTYRWGESTNEATLVPPEGLDEPILVNDAGVIRTQLWRYPSRSECLACHTPVAGYALGFNTPQLNRDVLVGTNLTNQILALAAAGYFSTAVSNVQTLPALAELSDVSISREFRVRSYLAANCASCHQPEGSSSALWDARITTPTSLAGLVNGMLNIRFSPKDRVVVPGSIEHSMLHSRIAEWGGFHMPPIGSSVVHQDAVDLLRAWITNDLAEWPTFAAWQTNVFGSVDAPNAGREDDADDDGASNYFEYLTGTNPLEAGDAWSVSIRATNDVMEISFPQIANRLFELQINDQFASPYLWKPLDVPENRPFAAVSNRVAVLRDFRTNAPARLYRVRIREP